MKHIERLKEKEKKNPPNKASMLRRSLVLRRPLTRLLSTPSTSTPAKKSRWVSKTVFFLSGTLLAVYGGGIYISNKNDRFTDLFLDNVPYAVDVMGYYDTLKAEGKLDEYWNKFKSLVSAGTVGMPVHVPHERGELEVKERGIQEGSSLKASGTGDLSGDEGGNAQSGGRLSDLLRRGMKHTSAASEREKYEEELEEFVLEQQRRQQELQQQIRRVVEERRRLLVLNLQFNDDLKLEENAKGKVKMLLDELKEAAEALNKERLEVSPDQLHVVIDRFNSIYQSLAEFNKLLEDDIADEVQNGCKGRLRQLEEEFAERTAGLKDELREDFTEQFQRYKEFYDEYSKKAIEADLKANEERLLAKQANEISILSITQVEEFNKIIESKVEEERNGKLANLKELDERVTKLGKALSSVNKLLVRNEAITKLTAAVATLRRKFGDANCKSIKISDEIERMQSLAAILPTTETSACSCPAATCKCKNCSHRRPQKPTLLGVALDELQSVAGDKPILSDEQLYNRWTLLERDFKTASLLPPSAGIMGHLTAKFFSGLLFTKEGNPDKNAADLDALFSRVQYNLRLHKLEDAVEEAVTLSGWPRVLCENWIEDARRKLEVEKLVDVIDSDLKTL